MLKNENDVKEFLKKHPNPTVEAISTINRGCVSCIGPVPTLFGATIHCCPSVVSEVKQLIRNNN